jgi:hypothetical protein
LRERAFSSLAEAIARAEADLQPTDRSLLDESLLAALADTTRGQRERLAAGRALWSLRSPRTVPRLVELLARNQHGQDGAVRCIRDLCHSLLRDLLGTTTFGNSRNAAAQTSDEPGPDEPERWQALASARRAGSRTVQRGRPTRPPSAPTGAKLFEAPLIGARILFLVDASGALRANLPATRAAPPTRGTPPTQPAPAPTADSMTLQERVAGALVEAIGSLPVGVEYRVVFYNRNAASHPRNDWAVAGDPKEWARVRRAIEGLKTANGIDLHEALGQCLGLSSLGFTDRFDAEPLPTDVVWLTTGHPTDGPIRSAECWKRLFATLNQVPAICFHVFELADQRPQARETIRAALRREFMAPLRELAADSGGRFLMPK